MKLTLVGPVLACLLAACGGSTAEKPKAASPHADAESAPLAAGAPRAESAKATGSPTTASVVVDPEIARACGIAESDAHFDYDSSRVRPEDTRTLDAIARCFSAGPLKGRRLQLVGHADPRGDADYNFTLGQLRADSIASFLNTKGVAKDRESTTSRGSMDASGSDDTGWARDRRVDLRLAR